MKRNRTRSATGTLSVLVALAGTYAALHRLGRRWGATDAEAHAPLAGDEMVPHPVVETTHAITIGASAAQVWPWLVQMGYGRAGWYTNDWWYRLIDRYVFHVTMPRVDRILPELQHLAQGDVIPDGPPGTAFFTVAGLDPEWTLALYSTTHGTVWLPQVLRENPRFCIHSELGWVFVLREVRQPDRGMTGTTNTTGTTRLILRTRGAGGPAFYRALAWMLLPPADFFVARMLLKTVKRNAERAAGRQRQQLPEGAAMPFVQ